MSIHEVRYGMGNAREVLNPSLDEAIKRAEEAGHNFPSISISRTIYDGEGLPNAVVSREVTILKAESPESVALETHIKGADQDTGYLADILISRIVFHREQINGIKVPGMPDIGLRIGNRGYAWTKTPETPDSQSK